MTERKKKEYVAIKRQRLIQDDMKETCTKDLEKAYAAAMMNRVRIPPQLNKLAHNSKKRTQDDFCQTLKSYYGATNTTDGQKFVFCVVSGDWYVSTDVKAAHLVPKSLQSNKLHICLVPGTWICQIPKTVGYKFFSLSLFASKLRSIILHHQL